MLVALVALSASCSEESLDTRARNAGCPRLPPEAAAILGPLVFERLEADDPNQVCCHPYGIDHKRGVLLPGGRRHCSEEPLWTGRSLEGDQPFHEYSLGCFYIYHQGCPTNLHFLPNETCYRVDGRPLTTGFR
jgi:hypothetical protein